MLHPSKHERAALRASELYRDKRLTMANTAYAATGGALEHPAVSAQGPTYQAFQILHWGFVAAPVIAGGDKFLHLLTNWDHYLAPSLARTSPFSVHGTMLVVGVVEVVAGLVVALRPRVGAYVVAAWLAGIIVDLLLLGAYFDVALRDFGLLLGALALGRLSAVYDTGGFLSRRPQPARELALRRGRL
jgi:hypothetical protein